MGSMVETLTSWSRLASAPFCLAWWPLRKRCLISRVSLRLRSIRYTRPHRSWKRWVLSQGTRCSREGRRSGESLQDHQHLINFSKVELKVKASLRRSENSGAEKLSWLWLFVWLLSFQEAREEVKARYCTSTQRTLLGQRESSKLQLDTSWTQMRFSITSWLEEPTTWMEWAIS